MPALGIYLFTGPDRPRKLSRIQELERALTVGPLDAHHVDAGAVSAQELSALCRQRPAQSQARLVVVDDAHRLSRECVDMFDQQSALIAQSACVVILLETAVGVRHPLSSPPASWRTETFPDRESPAVKPFALAEALANRNKATALEIVRDQIRSGKEPVELFGLIGWQLMRWLLVRRLIDERVPPEQMAAATGLKAWPLQRVQAEVRNRSAESIQKLLEECWRLDTDSKTGRVIPALAVEQLVIEVCMAGEKTAVV